MTRVSLRLLLLLAVSWAIPLQASDPIDSKPNIIVMLVDDMGVMDTSMPFLTDDAG